LTSSGVPVTIPHLMTQKNTKYLTVRVDDDLLQKLAQLANQNERSTSSEARVAIRNHLDGLKVQPSLRRVAGDDPRSAA